jgi:hypothetical protein
MKIGSIRSLVPHDAAASYMGCWQPEFRTNELQDDKP